MNAKEVVDNDLEYILSGLDEELNVLSGKKLLITGGAGFLGYYLVQTIIKWNDNEERHSSDVIELIVYDNFIRGLPKWMSKFNGKANLTVKKHDVNDPIPSDLCDVDYIIHAASIASPIYYRKNPIQTMDANVNGLRHLLDYCRRRSIDGNPILGLLYFSTSEIYGDPDKSNIPTPESYRGNVSCTGPRACYDESKRYGETLCVNFSQQYDLPIKIARPFNNYGPGLKITDGRALPDFCLNVLSNQDIVMLSDGQPTRTFCYVADAIIGYFKVLINGVDGESYNVGTEEPEISIRQLANMVMETAADLFNYDGKLVFKNSSDKEYLTDNPNRRAPMIKKAKEHLAYNPSITIEEGLRRSLIWYKDNGKGVDA